MDLDDSVINSLKDDDYDTSCVHHSSMKQEFPKGKNAALLTCQHQVHAIITFQQ